MQGNRILIIGGGIGGLAAAVALRRAGFDPAVFERAAVYREVGAGLTLWANAIRALDKLGLGGPLRGRALAGGEAAFRDSRGRFLQRMSLEELRGGSDAVNVAVHRAELQSMLLDALGPGAVRTNCECVGFEQDAQGVTAHFVGGGTESGAALIGADGLRSAVRAQLLGPEPPKYAGYTAWRAVCPFERSRIVASETWGRGMRFGLLPLTEQRLYWFAAANAPEGQGDGEMADDRKRDLLARFGSWYDPIPEVIRTTPPVAILRNDIYDRDPVAHWGEGRVTLLGDAAHPMTPNFGQGACQAIEDAVALGECLRDQSDLPAALRAYEARRIPRTSRIVLESRRIGRIAQWECPVATTLRNFAVRLSPRSATVRQLTWMLQGDGS